MKPPGGLHAKTLVFSVVVILTNVLGNFALSVGMKSGNSVGASPLSWIRTVLNPWVMAGIALLMLWMLSRVTLLSWADLSYVLPVTSLGYVLNVAMGKVFLAEQISWQRWAGTLLILSGTVLVGLTSPRTVNPAPDLRGNR